MIVRQVPVSYDPASMVWRGDCVWCGENVYLHTSERAAMQVLYIAPTQVRHMCRTPGER